jgi:hypothetical protein
MRCGHHGQVQSAQGRTNYAGYLGTETYCGQCEDMTKVIRVILISQDAYWSSNGRGTNHKSHDNESARVESNE